MSKGYRKTKLVQPAIALARKFASAWDNVLALKVSPDVNSNREKSCMETYNPFLLAACCLCFSSSWTNKETKV